MADYDLSVKARYFCGTGRPLNPKSHDSAIRSLALEPSALGGSALHVAKLLHQKIRTALRRRDLR
jgi:hypothetical protein